MDLSQYYSQQDEFLFCEELNDENFHYDFPYEDETITLEIEKEIQKMEIESEMQKIEIECDIQCEMGIEPEANEIEREIDSAIYPYQTLESDFPYRSTFPYESENNDFSSPAIWQMVKQWLSDDQKERVHLISRGKMKRLIPKPHKLSALDGENIWKYAAVERAKNKNACMQKKSCKPARPHQMPNHCDPFMLEQATEPHLITTNDETQTCVEKNSVGTNVVAIRKKPCQKRSTHSVTKTWSGTDSLKSKDSSQDSTSRSHHGGSQHHQDSVGSHHSHHDRGGSHHSHHDSWGSHHSHHHHDSVRSHHSHHHHNSVRSQHSHHQNSVRSQGLDRQSTVEAHSASSIRSDRSTHQSNHGSNDNLETKCSNPPYIVLSNTRLPRTTFNPSQIVGKEANQEEKISNYVNIISGSLQRNSHDSGRSEGILKSTSHKSVSKVNSDLDTLDNIYESVFHETPVHEQRGTATSGKGSQDYLLQAVPSDVESDRSARIENKIYLCPAKVITFKTGITDESGNRYKKDIQIANCTTAGNRQDITYKIKTNAPNRYYVKPSMGIIQPGETQIISLSLDKNKTKDVKQDRFLILFNRCEDIGRNIAPFWKEKEKQGSYYQHRLKVRLSDGSNSHRGTCGTDNNIQVRSKKPSKIRIPATNSVHKVVIPRHSDHDSVSHDVLRKLEGDDDTKKNHGSSVNSSEKGTRSDAESSTYEDAVHIHLVGQDSLIKRSDHITSTHKSTTQNSEETSHERNDDGGVPNTRNIHSKPQSQLSTPDRASEENCKIRIPAANSTHKILIPSNYCAETNSTHELLRKFEVNDAPKTTKDNRVPSEKGTRSDAESSTYEDAENINFVGKSSSRNRSPVNLTQQSTENSEGSSDVPNNDASVPNTRNRNSQLLSGTSTEESSLLMTDSQTPTTRNRNSEMKNVGRKIAKPARVESLLQDMSAESEETSDLTFTPNKVVPMSINVSSPLEHNITSDNPVVLDTEAVKSTHSVNVSVEETNKIPSHSKLVTSLSNLEETSEDSSGFLFTNPCAPQTRNRSSLHLADNVSVEHNSDAAQALNSFLRSMNAQSEETSDVTFKAKTIASTTANICTPVELKSHSADTSETISDKNSNERLDELDNFIQTQKYLLIKSSSVDYAKDTRSTISIRTQKSLPDTRAITNTEETISALINSVSQDNHSRNENMTKKDSNSSIGSVSVYRDADNKIAISNTRNDQYINSLQRSNIYVVSEKASELSNTPDQDGVLNLRLFVDSKDHGITSLAKSKISVVSHKTSELSNISNVQDVYTPHKSKLSFGSESSSKISSTPTDQGAVLKSRVFVDSEESSGMSHTTNDQLINALHQSKTSVTSKKSSEVSSTPDQGALLKSRVYLDSEESSGLYSPNDHGITSLAKSKKSVSSIKSSEHSSTPTDQGTVLKSRVFVDSEESSGLSHMTNDQLINALHQSKTSVTSKKSIEFSSTPDQSVALKARLFVDAEETNEICIIPNDQPSVQKSKITKKSEKKGNLKSRLLVGSEEISDAPFIPDTQMSYKITAESELSDAPTTSYNQNVMNTRNRNSLLQSVDTETSSNSPNIFDITDPEMESFNFGTITLDINDVSRSLATTTQVSQISIGGSFSKTDEMILDASNRPLVRSNRSNTTLSPLYSEKESSRTNQSKTKAELICDEICCRASKLTYRRVFTLVIIFVWALMFTFMMFYYYSDWFFIPNPCPTVIEILPVKY